MSDDAGTPLSVSASERWLARLAFFAAGAVVLLLVIDGLSSIAVLVVGVLGLMLTLAGLWWFLSHRGLVRWLSAALAVASPTVATVYERLGLVTVGE